VAKFSQPSNEERPVEFFETLNDIAGDIPADILNADEADDIEGGDDDIEEDDKDDAAEDDDAGDDDAGEDEDDADEEEDDDNDDYFTKGDDEDEDKPKVADAPAPPAAVAQSDEAKFILDNLAKIAVNVIVEVDGKEVIQQVQVYGYGDLPANFKGYANPREGELFRGAVTAQELKAQQLQTQFQQNRQKADMEKASQEYTIKENRAIAEDLTELRKEGLFPKFKGNPGTKEFNESEGAKEFDKTVAFMNKKNDEYIQRANSGKNYRHIGFREAFEMLHGPNPKAAEQAEDRARKKIAGKVVSKRGTRAQTVKTGVARVNNLTDLAEEFGA
jgi:hypothetical protein